MSIHEGITFPVELGLDTRVERVMFRMNLPLSEILIDVNTTLDDMRQIDLETAVLLKTTLIDTPPIASTPECPVCCSVDLASSHHLPCGHVICGTCLTDWLDVAGTCPFCRHKLTNRRYVDDEFNPRNEAYARSILEQLYAEGRRYLNTNPADVTFRGFYNAGRSLETGVVGPKMELLQLLFQQFSTAFEDSAIQSDLGQNFKTAFWEQNSELIASGWSEKLWLALRCGTESPYTNSPFSY